MQLTALKTYVLSRLTRDEVRAAFGDLRLRQTWEVAADRCREYAAAAVEQVTEATQTAYAVFVPIAWGILWLMCLTFHAGEAVANWWHSAPAKATDSTAAVLSRFHDARLSSTVPIS